jgi:hypothetical protein
MKMLYTIAFLLPIASFAYGASMAVDKEAVIDAAKNYVWTLDPPVDLRNAAEPKAVYVEGETIWVVLFADMRPVPPPDSDFMITIDGITGKPLGLLGGVRKQDYYRYFASP